MDTKIRERPPVAALAGVRVSRPQKNQIPGTLRIAAAVDDDPLLPVQHIVKLILRVGMNWITPCTAYRPQMHAEQVQRCFDVRNNDFTNVLAEFRRQKSRSHRRFLPVHKFSVNFSIAEFGLIWVNFCLIWQCPRHRAP
ncbi:hypothetical protein D3C76_1334990 [compost metagenome]